MKITVQVTQEDIADGERYACCECPVALALKRATGREWFVTGVFLNLLKPGQSFTDSGVAAVELTLDTPQEVKTFIHAFDENDPVKPFTFEIETPEEVAA
jgi:hypothetical protein